MTVPASPAYSAPSSILIVGSGVFGLSTAYSLTKNPIFHDSQITVVDRSVFPSPDGSSIDSSRIVRPDYSDPAYSALANEAQKSWRQQGDDELGGQGRYSESGLLLVAYDNTRGNDYVRKSYENVSRIMKHAKDDGGVVLLKDRHAIAQYANTGGVVGDWGYINHRSGWADAEAAMVWLRKQVESTGRVKFRVADVSSLWYDTKTSSNVVGVQLKDGDSIKADLTILATGAWTPKLVDLRGRAQATGQVLAYIRLTDAEQEKLKDIPIILSFSTGMFVIPPRNNVLKVARHAYGYTNPVTILHPVDTSSQITVSLPRTSVDEPSQLAPVEGIDACREFLATILPEFKDKQFEHSRVCWYTDTPDGNFIITYHPETQGLFLATGGSGHGFKFLPVIGDKIVDCIMHNCPEEFKEKWAWATNTVADCVTEDGSRGGRPGMTLDVEMTKSRL